MDNYQTRSMFGSNRPELQSGFQALRKREIIDYLRENGVDILPLKSQYKTLDDVPKWELLKLCAAAVIRGEMRDISEAYAEDGKATIDEMRDALAAKDADIETLKTQMAELTALVKPAAVTATPVTNSDDLTHVNTSGPPTPDPFHVQDVNTADKEFHKKETWTVADDDPRTFEIDVPKRPEEMAWPELRQFAKERGINTKGLKRNEIIEALAG